MATPARGAQRLAKAVKILCGIIGNNPDVVDPDSNPLRRAVYDSVTLACDLFDEFIPVRIPTAGGVSYGSTLQLYGDGVSEPTNFDRSGGKYIVQIVRGVGLPALHFAIRVAKGTTDLTVDMTSTDFHAAVETSWTDIGQALADVFPTGYELSVVDTKRNVQGHLTDEPADTALPVYTSASSLGVTEPSYIVTTITYKDQNGNQDRVQLPGTVIPLGKRVVSGAITGSDGVIRLCGWLSDTDSKLVTRKGGASINPIMHVSTISNAKQYRKFFEV